MSIVSSLPLLTAYRALARNLPDTTVLMYDGGLRFLLAEGTDLQVLGFKSDHVVGLTAREALPAKLAARYEPHFKAALTGTYQVIEEDLGDRLPIYQMQFTPARNDDGSIFAGMMICQNVTELRTTQRNLQARLDELTVLHARLSELEQLKTDMLKLGAHDLRSPLMVIMNYTQYLAEDLTEIGTPEQLDYINEIRGAAERMKIISHDILDAGRIEHLLDRTALDPVELVGTLRAAAEGLQANAAIKHHTMTICVPENDVCGRGDAPLLREAAVNLIGNAIQYTPEGGRIDVVVSVSKGGVEFTVTDTGYGVPPDTRDQLFQPLARVGSKEARREAGTGFGLYLVKRIVERHGGNVFFRSGRIQGSTFGFWLPAERV